MPTKKEKNKPVILHTREAMEATVSEFITKQLRYLELKAKIEQAKLAAGKEHEAELNTLVQEMDRSFAGIQNFCELHRRDLLPTEKKSFETATAIIGFRDTPPAVDKIRSKETWGAIAKRLEGLVFKRKVEGAEDQELDCAAYVKQVDPDLDKNGLLADRSKFTDEELRIMGIRFTQEEHFYVNPKSEIASLQTAEAQKAA